MKNFLTASLIIVLVFSCGTASEAKNATFSENVKAGNRLFENGKYRYATSRLKRAIEQQPDSLNVLAQWVGWASLRSDAVDSAITYFDVAYVYDDTNYDVIAGQAFALNIKAKALSAYAAHELMEKSNMKAEHVLDENPDWYFPYGINLGKEHLILLMAQNYFGLGDFYDSEDYAYDLSTILVTDSIVTDSVRNVYFDYPSLNSQEGQAGLALALEWLFTEL